MRLIIVYRALYVGTSNCEPKLSYGWQNRTGKHINNCRWPMKKSKKIHSSKSFNIATIYVYPGDNLHAKYQHRHSYAYTLHTSYPAYFTIHKFITTEWKPSWHKSYYVHASTCTSAYWCDGWKDALTTGASFFLSVNFSSAALKSQEVATQPHRTLSRAVPVAVIYYIAFSANFNWFEKLRL